MRIFTSVHKQATFSDEKKNSSERLTFRCVCQENSRRSRVPEIINLAMLPENRVTKELEIIATPNYYSKRPPGEDLFAKWLATQISGSFPQNVVKWKGKNEAEESQ